MAVKDIHIDLIKSMSFATNSTGGNYRKTLTRDEIPMYNIGQFPSAVPISHSDWDSQGIYGAILGKVPIGKHGIKSCADNAFEGDDTTTQYGWRITSNGGGGSFDISQPYIVVTFWKRVN